MAGGRDWVEQYIVDSLSGPDVRAAGFVVVQAVAAAVGLPVSPPLEAAVRRALSSLKHKGAIIQTGRYWMLAAAYKQQAGPAARKARGAGSDGSRRTSDEHRDGDAYKTGSRRREVPPQKPVAPPVTPEIKRLAGVLGMLGSEHEGEVLSAARRAETIRRKIGKDWLAILTQSKG